MKTCWLAKQYNKGWRLGFCVGNQKPYWLPKVWFMDKKDIDRALNSSCVFIWLTKAKLEAK